jgi:transglutaminase-like putative cysteine protease
MLTVAPRQSDDPTSPIRTTPFLIPLPSPFPAPVAVNRCLLRVAHLTDYRYPDSAREICTEIRLVPPDQRGWQHLNKYDVRVAPLSYSRSMYHDRFGNRVYELRNESVRNHLTIAVELMVENWCAYDASGAGLPTPIAIRDGEPTDAYREFTHRTFPDETMQLAAQEVESATDYHDNPLRFLETVGLFVHHEMRFSVGTTGVETTAIEAWKYHRGVCQDYAHVTLALLRRLNIPGRYVSGFVPGEGVMHAWIEALLPLHDGDSARYWFAYDPTYGQWTNENYVTVAVGRDYGDITPTSGTYFGGTSALRYRNSVERKEREVIVL